MAAAPWSPYAMGLMAAVMENNGQPEPAARLLNALSDRSHDGGVGMVCYHLTRGEIDSVVEWVRRAAAHRFPAFIPVWIRAFEPLVRESAAWPDALKAFNLTPAR